MSHMSEATHPIKEAEIRINAVVFRLRENTPLEILDLIEEQIDELEDIQEMLQDALERSGIEEVYAQRKEK